METSGYVRLLLWRFYLCDMSLSMVCMQEPINKLSLKRIQLSIIIWENEGKKTNQ